MKKYFFYLFMLLSFHHAFSTNIADLRVSFHGSMSLSERYSIEYAQKDLSFMVAKYLYDFHFLNNPNYSERPRIPKIIHHIWLGSPFGKELQQMRQKWIDLHPDWQFILWTEKEIEEFCLQNKEAFDHATNYGEKSDIARYEILYRMGGLYVDTDFECLQPMDYLHHCCHFYAGLGPGPGFHVYNGLIACKPKHPILKQCIENIITTPVHEIEFIDILYRTGPYYLTKCVKETLLLSDKLINIIFPTSFFYPWPHFHREDNLPEHIAAWIRPESLALHHWHVSWNNGQTRYSR